MVFVDSVEMINFWKFQPSSPYDSEVIEIWKFDQNGCSGVKSAILNFSSSHPFILKSGMGKFFGGEKSKNHT